MKVQVLVATMNQTDYSLLDKMNIQTDAIVCNQCDKYDYAEFDYKGHNIKWFSFAERGVGLNRNNALMRATADVCVLADDDMIFQDGYCEIIERVFEKSNVEVAAFNLVESVVKRYVIDKKIRITKKNYGRYGAARIAFRRESVIFNGISFNLLFGGGAKYSAGEDTLFLKDCIEKKLKFFGFPLALAYMNEEDRVSSWFSGYNDKYFLDKGVLYYCLNKRMCKALSLYHCFKHRKRYAEYGWKNAYKMMKKGIDALKYKK